VSPGGQVPLRGGEGHREALAGREGELKGVLVAAAEGAEHGEHPHAAVGAQGDGVGVVVVGDPRLGAHGRVEHLLAPLAAHARLRPQVVAGLAVLDHPVAAHRVHRGDRVARAAPGAAVDAHEVHAVGHRAKREVLPAPRAARVGRRRGAALQRGARGQHVHRGVRGRVEHVDVKVPGLPAAHLRAEEALVAREVSAHARRELPVLIPHRARVDEQELLGAGREARHRVEVLAALGERERAAGLVQRGVEDITRRAERQRGEGASEVHGRR
jgi:hypothetical protein